MAEIAILGGGPAGLFAADILAGAGHRVAVFERMPSLARKFLMAGRGGLNLTHAEPLERFLGRYPDLPAALEAAIRAFPPDSLRDFAALLGQTTFIGTSGRVFPAAMKASPLLRAWLARLAARGVDFHLRHEWRGWDAAGALVFDTPDGMRVFNPRATLLAMGGASWPRLGSHGGWVGPVEAKGVPVAPLIASNAGVMCDWSAKMRERAGDALKRTHFSFGEHGIVGEAVVTAQGLEGGAIYALGAAIRAGLARGEVTLRLDFRPDLALAMLEKRLSGGRRGDSLANRLRKGAGLAPAPIGLMHEAARLVGQPLAAMPEAALARLVKACPVRVIGMAGLERAISSAGGLRFAALTPDFMLRAMPGTFAVGEMLDWDAPTGGYLLQACFATAHAAAAGMMHWLAER